MNAHEFLDEYDNLTVERRAAGLRRLMERLINDPGQYGEFIYDTLTLAVALEEDDYWGTEGLDL